MIAGIVIEKNPAGFSTRESIALQMHALDQRIPCRFGTDPQSVPPGWMAAGGFDFVEEALQRTFPPDHFPDFCKDHIGRGWWIETKALPTDRPLMLKPADRLKRFHGYIHHPGTIPEDPPWIIQELVRFTEEFRYYVTGGRVATAAWYPSQDIPEPDPLPEAPPLPAGLEIPPDWSGTLDFGKTSEGRFLLVEAHPPFACGWYGEQKDYRLYAEWLIAGWESVTLKQRQF